MILHSTASIEISTASPLDTKTLYLLRRRLQSALEEAADNVLAEMDISNQFVHTIEVDEIEADEDEEIL
jgi:hypothetical protein